MKNVSIALFSAIIFAIAALVPTPALAWTPKSFVYTDNQSDTYVWITVYGNATTAASAMAQLFPGVGQVLTNAQIQGSIQGAWCVAPHSYDKHGLSTQLFDVRAEVMSPASKNCAHPVVLDSTHAFAGDRPVDNDSTGPAPAGMYNESTPEAQIHPGLLTLIGSKGVYQLAESKAASH